VADFLLHSGFMQNVTVPHAKFRTELVVNLYSGWIVQLVNASFAWRTHKIPFLYIKMNNRSIDIAPMAIPGGLSSNRQLFYLLRTNTSLPLCNMLSW
jgi:hypothetical protein